MKVTFSYSGTGREIKIYGTIISKPSVIYLVEFIDYNFGSDIKWAAYYYAYFLETGNVMNYPLK